MRHEIKINRDIPDEVELELTPCPNGCNGGDLAIFDGIDMLHWLPGQYSLVRCVSCGLERTNPRPSPSTIGYYYPEDYAPYRHNNFQVKEKDRGSLKYKIKDKVCN